MMKKIFFIFSMILLTATPSCAPDANLFSKVYFKKNGGVKTNGAAQLDKKAADSADKKAETEADKKDSADKSGKADKADASKSEDAGKADDKEQTDKKSAEQKTLADAHGSEEAGKTPKTGETDYKIGSGDILEIITWKEQDFSKELLVRIDGNITFPLIDDIHVGGLTPLQVKQMIEDKLKEFIENPIVNVTVKKPESQKFYILGEVPKTGEYPLIKNLTVLQAFALAGGFTEWASKKEIILIRHEDGKEQVIRINYKNIAKGKDFSENIFIKANDTIIVP